ncbi:MAG: hypothetical protein CML42_05585 [Rhodobacteraceae bacterium]|nr:hypothetical protein [Paracoccaceae bacterium]
MAQKYNKKKNLINIMLKSHFAKLLQKLKNSKNKQGKDEHETKKITNIIKRRHRSQSPLKLDNILIKLN